MLSRLEFLHLVGLSSALPFLERFDVGPRPERLTHLWSGPVAGFQFHQGLTVADDLEPGHLLLLVREPDNAYDDCAIAVYSASTKLGYVPRTDNLVLATMLDSGEYQLLGKVEEAAPDHHNPWERLLFSVFHVPASRRIIIGRPAPLSSALRHEQPVVVLQVLPGGPVQNVLGQHLQRLAVEAVVLLAVLKFLPDAAAHVHHPLIGVNGEIVAVEELVQVGAEQQAIAERIGAPPARTA